MNVKTASRDWALLSKEDNFGDRVDAWFLDNPEIFGTEGYRPQERQNYLHSLGRTIAGKVVTWTLNSLHTKGLAVDIAFHGDALYPNMNTEEGKAAWRKVADSAAEHGIDWGWDLWGADAPHFQDAEATFTYPPKSYRENAVPAWANEFTDNMEAADISTPPETTVGDMPLYQLIGVVHKYVKAGLKLGFFKT